MRIPREVTNILERLHESGHEAFIVGGCVRDGILGKRPQDWDITTSALPEEIKSIFRRTIDTGIKHGTVTVLAGKNGYEVTTYRVDGKYSDGRHPDSVTFTRSLEEDLRRRDFTINAMAYSPDRGLIDLFGGEDDLKEGIIRCVGVPDERFGEDALRMMRALRFSAQLGFEIDGATAASIRKNAHTLEKVSAERISAELVKLLISPHPEKISLACDLGLTAVFLPEYDRIRGVAQNTPNHIYDVEKHTLLALMGTEPRPVLRLTMLVHDFGKADVKKTLPSGRDIFYGHPEKGACHADNILRRLKFDNHTRNSVVRLVRWHGLKYEAGEASVRRAVNRVGEDLFEDFIKVQRADIKAKNPAVIPDKLRQLDEKEALYHKVISEGQCFSISSLDIGGRELIEAGIEKGSLIGTILDLLCEAVIDDQSLNRKDVLLSMALDYASRKESLEPVNHSPDCFENNSNDS